MGTEIELEKWVKVGNLYSEDNDDGVPIGDFCQAWTLGYGRHGLGWRILVREYKLPDGSSEGAVQENVTALLEASRDIRITAAEQIPDLLKAIEEAVKEKIEILKKVSDKR